MVVNPYSDYIIDNNTFIRTFDVNIIDELDLVWHMDRVDRCIDILEGEGWMFQLDDELPYELNVGDSLFIPKNTFHRVHKGKTNLKIKINHGR